jgi:hypothetical protein
MYQIKQVFDPVLKLDNPVILSVDRRELLDRRYVFVLALIVVLSARLTGQAFVTFLLTVSASATSLCGSVSDLLAGRRWMIEALTIVRAVDMDVIVDSAPIHAMA